MWNHNIIGSAAIIIVIHDDELLSFYLLMQQRYTGRGHTCMMCMIFPLHTQENEIMGHVGPKYQYYLNTL